MALCLHRGRQRTWPADHRDCAIKKDTKVQMVRNNDIMATVPDS